MPPTVAPSPSDPQPDPQPDRQPHSLRIAARFNGPRTSGNGGWTAGLLAQLLPGGPVSVALRAPVPLDTRLALRQAEAGALQLCAADGSVVAEAAPATLALDLPAWPSVDEAEQAGALGRLAQGLRPADSAYAHCFVCGFARADGLRLAPGPVAGQAAGPDAGAADTPAFGTAHGLVATIWVPAAELADAQGQVGAAAVWAALDCPAGMAWSAQLPPGAPIVTVRMTVAIDQPLRAGARYRLMAWPIRRDGRKLHAGSALVDDADGVCARSQQLWLMPREAAA